MTNRLVYLAGVLCALCIITTAAADIFLMVDPVGVYRLTVSTEHRENVFGQRHVKAFSLKGLR